MKTALSLNRLILLLLPIVLIGPLSMDMYLPAIPEMRHAFHASQYLVQWTLSSFALGFGISQLMVGYFSAKFGSSRCLQMALIIYCLASIGANLSTSIEAIIIARFIQALGACFTMVLTMALVRHYTDSVDENIKAYSIFSAATALAPIFAPILGVGLIAYFGSWRIIFALLALLSFIGFVIFVKSIRSNIQWQHTPESILGSYLMVIKSYTFWLYALYGAMGMTILFSFFSISPLILIEHNQFSTQQFSLVFGGYGLCFLVGNLAAPYWSKYKPGLYGQLLAYTIIIINCLIGLFIFSLQKQHLTYFLLVMFINNFLIGLTFGPALAGAMKLFKMQSEQASSIYGFQQFFFAFIVGTLIVKLNWISEIKYISALLFILVPINGWIYFNCNENC